MSTTRSPRLRICVLRAKNKDVEENFDLAAGLVTEYHIFEQRFIDRARIKQDLGSAAADSFDLFFNCFNWDLRGQADHPAAIQVARCLEELRIPVIGVPSRVLGECLLGSGSLSLPKAQSLQGQTSGTEYACVVVELDSTPMALFPVLRQSGAVLERASNPTLHELIRNIAEKAFYANDLQGCCWCTILVSITDVTTPAAAAVIGVYPMAPLFDLSAAAVIQKAHAGSIRESFPGGYRSFIHSLIASFFLNHGRKNEVFHSVGQDYDAFATNYDTATSGIYYDGVRNIMTKYRYDGLVLDLACGTGLPGRIIGESQGLNAGDASNPSKFIGIDVSTQMREECMKHGWYENVIVGPIQKAVITFSQAVDHVICIGALHYLDINEISLVLSRAFQLARSSVTFTIDEIPETYNAALAERGHAHMSGFNHLAEIEAYGIPVGWQLADKWRRVGWNSPSTGYDVYTNVFRFERVL